jgi:predicted O-linked N-acetylglucosamine transferase (SPINDLY family)
MSFQSWPIKSGNVYAGILRMMGMPETIVETLDEYVALAVRMGRDPSFRAGIKKRIAGDKHRLYRDRACIAALEDFLDRAARAQA